MAVGPQHPLVTSFMFEMLYPLDLPLLVCLFSGEGPGHLIMNINPLNKVLFSNSLSQAP